MRILAVSDTHIPVTESKLPDIIITEAAKSDICIHAGDFIETEVLRTLSAATKTFGVRGNMDTADIRKCLPDKQIIEIENIKIGLTHGRGAPADIISTVSQIFNQEFASIDIFVFGHSHMPISKKIKGKLFFNPGSPTDKIFAPYRSYGIIEINNGRVKGEIIKI